MTMIYNVFYTYENVDTDTMQVIINATNKYATELKQFVDGYNER